MIDPKELHIGSHILVSGKRVEIECITNDSQIGYYLPNYDDWEACSPDKDWVEPIPITEELLKELGFHKSIMCGEWIAYAKDIDAIIIRVAFQGAVCKCAEVRDNDNKEMMFGWSCPCKYLHELESFVHLTTKTELIKE